MTIEAGVAHASANSYLTVTAADALAAADMGPEADKWLAATSTTDLRERALKRATRELDGYVRTGWPRYSGAQALLFPRSIDVTTATPPVAFIPTSILQACYHQAAYVLKNASIIDAASTRHARSLSSANDSDVSGSESEEGLHVISPRALHYLAGYSVATATKSGSIRSLRLSSGFPGSPT